MLPDAIRELAIAARAMPFGEDHFIFTVEELARFLALATERELPPLPY